MRLPIIGALCIGSWHAHPRTGKVQQPERVILWEMRTIAGITLVDMIE